MSYLLQITRSDFEMLAATQVDAPSIRGLKYKAKAMVEMNPVVKGAAYRIWEITKCPTGRFQSNLVKEGVIAA